MAVTTVTTPVTTQEPEPQEYPSVSVIVPIYNGEADLPELLARLRGQRYPTDRVEYVLVDNGSRDRTPDLLQAAVGLVAGEIKALPSTHWLQRYADRQGTLSQKNTLNHPFLPYGQTANLALRAQVLDQVGAFRPHLTTGGDADLCWRIKQATPWQLVQAADAVVYHRHRDRLKDLRSQWYRYGCSNGYLHNLHGVALMRPLTVQEIGYRLLRWGLKELPQATAQLLTGQGTALDLAITPLDLWCAQARSQGQAQARLPAAAHAIARPISHQEDLV